MKHPLRIAAIALGFGIVVAGTIQTVRGAQAQDVYNLVTVDGAPLPVAVEQEDGCTDEVTTATLTLHADGRWEMASTERETCGQAVHEDSDSEEGRYERDGQNLRFLDGDGDDAAEDDADDDEDEIDIDDLESGTAAGAGLSVRLEGGQTLVFER